MSKEKEKKESSERKKNVTMHCLILFSLVLCLLCVVTLERGLFTCKGCVFVCVFSCVSPVTRADLTWTSVYKQEAEVFLEDSGSKSCSVQKTHTKHKSNICKRLQDESKKKISSILRLTRRVDGVKMKHGLMSRWYDLNCSKQQVYSPKPFSFLN